ncbi:MAG: TonB-dependent receptor [Bacteroidota bacterium]
MKTILSTIILLLSVQFIHAQNPSIKGTVTDEDGIPLEGATILVVNTSNGVTTNGSGYYEISNLNAGDYKILVQFLGYADVTRNVSFSGTLITLDVQLETAVESLQDVEIIGRRNTDYKPDVTFAGTKTATDIKLVPQSIAILNKEIVADQGLFRLGEISENVAGLTRIRDADGFNSRGFRVNQGYINGNRALIGTDFANSTLAVQYERIEVVKGPSAALFGNSSPGGIINGVTKKPLTENRASATLSYGSFDTKRGTADVTGPVNDAETLLYRVNFAWENAETFRDFQKNRAILFAPSLSYLLNENTSFNVDIVGSFNNDQAGVDRGSPVLQGDLFALPISFNTAEPYDNRQNSSILLTASGSHKFSDNLSVNVSYTRSDFDQNFLETRSANRFTEDGTELIRNINDRITDGYSDFVTAYLVGKFKTGAISHEAVFGWEYFENQQVSETRSAQGEINGVPNLSFNNRQIYDSLSDLLVNFSDVTTSFTSKNQYRGLYVQDLIGIGAFKILGGLRYENLDQDAFFIEDQNISDLIDNNVILPRLGVTWQLNDKINVFASYSESFQPQTLPLGVSDVEQIRGVDALTSDQIEFGTKSSFFGNRLLVQASLYSINRNGRLIEDPASSGGFVNLLQIGDEVSRGFELDISGRISNNFTLIANYAFNEIEIKDDTESIALLELEENNPKHTAGFWGKYTFTDGFFNNLGIGAGGRFVAESQIVDTTPTAITDRIFFDSYFTARLGLFYKIDKFNINFNLNNAFDERYFIGGLNAGRVFPGAPRNFLVTLGYSF